MFTELGFILFMKTFSIVPALSLLSIFSLSGKIVPDPMFSDNMVLQRDLKVPIWGTADPGEQVTVSFRSQSKVVEAGKNGKWRLSSIS